MRQTFMVAAATLAALAVTACQPAAKAPEPNPAAVAEPVEVALADLPPAPAGEIIATLSKVEDAGYPMFWLSLTPEAGPTVGATLNNEEVSTPDGITALAGKKVNATVTVTAKNNMLRLSAGAAVVYEMERAADAPLQIPADAKTVTGKITGLKEVSGDLPSLLTLTAKDGTKMEFEHYVDESLAKYDGTEMTVLYNTYQSSEVTKITLAP
jgi:hypothetical protein